MGNMFFGGKYPTLTTHLCLVPEVKNDQSYVPTRQAQPIVGYGADF